MITQFQIHLPNVQPEVCIEPSNFQDGQIPQAITVFYQKRFPYNYRFKHRDTNGNYCYVLMSIVAGKGRGKKKTTPPAPPCPSICVSGVSMSGLTPCGTPEVVRVLIDAPEASSYLNQLVASGGIAPYTFMVIAGSLPSALILSTTGLISGIPLFSVGNHVFTVQATDSNKCQGTQVFSIRVTND